MDRSKTSEWGMPQGAEDRVNIPCLISDTHLCQVDIKMADN